MAKAKVAIYTTSNGIMLGTKADNVISGIFINDAGNVSEKDFANLALATMKDELQEVVIGANDTFGKGKLGGKEKIMMQVVELQMKEAKNLGENWVTEQVFSELRGKK